MFNKLSNETLAAGQPSLTSRIDQCWQPEVHRRSVNSNILTVYLLWYIFEKKGKAGWQTQIRISRLYSIKLQQAVSLFVIG